MDELWSCLPRGAVLVCAGVLTTGAPAIASGSGGSRERQTHAAVAAIVATQHDDAPSNKAPTCGPCCHGSTRPECSPVPVDEQSDLQQDSGAQEQDSGAQEQDSGAQEQDSGAQEQDGDGQDSDGQDRDAQDSGAQGQDSGPAGDIAPPPIEPKQGCAVEATADQTPGELALLGLALAGLAQGRRRRRRRES